MRILFLSCHEVLAHDECSLLQELGHEVFSPDSFVSEENKGDFGLRPGIKKCENYDALMEEWHTFGRPGKDNKTNISESFFKKFDVVICMHLAHEWLGPTWDRVKASGIVPVLRTIGQFISQNEKNNAKYVKDGLKVVRYSPRERTNPGFCGEDVLIRFYKDPDDFGPWNGQEKVVLTFAQSMKKRGSFCNFSFFENTTQPFPRILIGPGNEGTAPFAIGKVSYDELKNRMRNHRCYFYTGTHPASYTLNFLESAMSGCPIVAIGSEYGNAKCFPGHNLYEIPDIIKNGENGFCSDNVEELRKYIKLLMDDDDLAKNISENIRKTAIDLFGKEKVKGQWQEFLSRL